MTKQKIAFVLIVAIAFLAMAGGAEANSRSELAVQVDTSGPTIVSYTISNHTITPPQTTKIDVKFSEKVSYKIAIENDTGTIICDWSRKNVTNPNPKEWNGSDENGTQVPDGNYYVNVTGTNTTTGLSVVNNTEVIRVSADDVYGVKLSADTQEQTVAPNVAATYTLTVKNTGTVTDNYTLNVTNENGASVATLNKTAIANLGVGASENVLLNVSNATEGTFVVNVTATSEKGGVGENDTITTTTTVQNVRLSIVSYTISNRTITPPQTTKIDVKFSEKVSYKIAIENDTGTIYKWAGNAKDPKPKVWNGTYESDGTVVPAGNYTVNVTGTNTTTGEYVINNTEIITVTSAGTLKITYYAPGTPVYDDAAATRAFNVTVNQLVNVSWQINGTEVQLNETVTEAAYTNQSAANGTWNVSAVVSNTNGTAVQTWLWHVGVNQQPIASFSYSPCNPLINQTITFNASDSKDHDGNITNYEWDFGDGGNITNTTELITNHTYASAGTFTVNLTVTDDEGATNTTSKTITVSEGFVFDTGTGTYPSIAGTHNGTITTNVTIRVSKLYTYPCEGTGGHPEHVIIRNESGIIAEADWKGYQVDGHNISFDDSFRLVANETYNYTIRTGSYPQIIHADSKTVAGGTITCDTFVDANGNAYTDWIPAIRLGE